MYFIFIEIYLIYNIVLVSGVQHSDSVTYVIYIHIFQIVFHYRLLQDAEYTVPCGIQEDLIVYLFYV